MTLTLSAHLLGHPTLLRHPPFLGHRPFRSTCAVLTFANLFAASHQPVKVRKECYSGLKVGSVWIPKEEGVSLLYR